MAEKSKIVIDLTINEDEARRVKTWIASVAKDMETLEGGKVGLATQVTQQQVQNQQNLSKSIKGSIEQYEFEDQKLNQLLQTARALGKDEQFYAIIMKKGYTEGIIEIQKMLGLKRQDLGMTKEQIQSLQRHATVLRHESIALRRGAADLHLFAQSAFIAGSAIVGGAVLLAKQYSDSMGIASVAGAEFAASMDRLDIAKNRIGKTFAEQLLPFIEETTQVIDSAGKFLQDHPEVAQAAIKGGEILIGIGLLGKGLATTVRLTADVLAIQSSITRLIATRAEEALVAEKQMAAAEAMNIAADKQLTAAQGMGAGGVAGGTGKAAGASGFLSGVSPVTAIATAVTTALVLNIALAKQLDRLEQELPNKFKGMVDYFGRILEAVPMLQILQPFRDLEKALNRDIPLLSKFVQHLLGIEKAPAGRINAADIVTPLEMSSHLQEVLDAWIKYKETDEKAEQDHNDKLLEINRDRMRAEEEENKQFARKIDEINKDLARSIDKARTSAARTEQHELEQLQEADKKAEAKLQDELNKIRSDAAAEAVKIQEDLQKKLDKLAQDHNDKERDLLAARDAVGLLNERRRYEREVADAHAAASEQAKEKRVELRDRIAELRHNYEVEKQERYHQYELDKAYRAQELAQRIAEMQEDAKTRVLQAEEDHKLEMEQIRQQAIDKINEENRQYLAERQRRYNEFIQRIRDLDASLLGEVNLRRKYYYQMQLDLDAFLTAYRNKLRTLGSTTTVSPTGGTVGTKAFGGYASYGLHMLGDNPSGGKGPDEFVLTGSTTAAAERIIGGRLSQRAVLAAMLRGGRSSVTLNDHRRFDSRVSAEDRRAIMQDTYELINSLVN